MEEASGRDLERFFRAWLHATWTRVNLAVGDSAVRLDSRDPIRTVTVVTAGRPDSAVLDPRGVLPGTSIENDREQLRAQDP